MFLPGEFPQLQRCLFGCKISLSLGKQLIADHEFFHLGTSQQRRQITCMKLPMFAFVTQIRAHWRKMKAHRIRKRAFEQVVVLDQNFFHYISQSDRFSSCDVLHANNVSFRQQDCLIWPHSPIRHQHNPITNIKNNKFNKIPIPHFKINNFFTRFVQPLFRLSAILFSNTQQALLFDASYKTLVEFYV